MASLTCPQCRHVVEVADGAGGKCNNCGAAVRRPPPPYTPTYAATAPQPPSADAPPAASQPQNRQSPAVSAAAGSTAGHTPTTTVRAASIVCLVCGLLFFVPFVAQAVGLAVGAIAVFRRRAENERIAAAWVGITLCLLALVGWTAGLASLTRIRKAGIFTMPTPVYDSSDQPEWHKPMDWATELERLHQAASAYRRDFDRWPSSVADLRGHSLPQSYQLPDDLTYHPVPEGEADRFDRLLVVSEGTYYDREAVRLVNPHRMVLRLSGRIEMLPLDQVDALLAGQPSVEPAGGDAGVESGTRD